MGTEKLDTEVRREQIAQAMLILLGTRGFRGLSMAQVAHHVGIVPSAIYRHFKNKDAILDAVIDLIGDRLLGNVQTVCGETSVPVERLKRLLMRHAGFIRENKAIPFIIFSEDVYFRKPKRKARIEGVLRKFLDRVADIIREGQEQGQIRSDIDPGTLSVMFVGLFQPAAILWHMSEGRFNVTRHVERAWKVFSDAIAKR